MLILGNLWFIIIFVLIIGYFALDGFDLGAGGSQVRKHIRQDGKAFLGQNLRCPDGFLIVRQQVAAVPHNLNLHKIATAQLPGETGYPHRLIGIPCPGGFGDTRWRSGGPHPECG